VVSTRPAYGPSIPTYRRRKLPRSPLVGAGAVDLVFVDVSTLMATKLDQPTYRLTLLGEP
jgi:hypothetical protein